MIEKLSTYFAEKPGRLPRVLVLASLLILLAIGSAKGWRLWSLYRQFSAHEDRISAWQSAGIRGLDPDEAATFARDFRRDSVALDQELRPYLPLAPYLTWLPRIGALMPVAENLLDMLDDGSLAVLVLAERFSPVLALLQTPDRSLSDQMPALIALLDEGEGDLAISLDALRRVDGEFAALLAHPEAVAALPFKIRSRLPLLQKGLPLALKGLIISRHLPALAGAHFPVSYLLVAQNEDELRATGGFISGVGILQVDQGRLGDLNFVDAYEIDDFLNKPYPLPPAPLEDLMGTQLFLFRDANYWPDFPRSAVQMMDLYTLGREVEIDGLIAIDQQFLAGLVRQLNPVEVPELSLTLTGENIADALRGAWETGDPDAALWFTSRKSFLGPVANALKQDLEREIFDLDPFEFFTFLQEAIAQKQLQFYFRDSEAMAAFEQIGWSSRVPVGDFEDRLMVVETNIGFNKVNAVVSRSIDYRVSLTADGHADAALSLLLQNHGRSDGTACQHAVPRYSEGTVYDSLVNDCLWNFVRVFVPIGAAITGGSTHPQPEGTLISGQGWAGPTVGVPGELEDLGLAAFGNLLVVPPGEQIRMTLDYRLPDVIGRDSGGRRVYRLHLAKQAGAPAGPLNVTVSLPPGGVPVTIAPEPAAIDGTDIRFEFDFDRDLLIEITYDSSDR